MFIIGTAGHIDHGKSSLVQALTGMDPDRLPEEKRRGMTIDLGFAWMESASGETIGIVDVPGHKDLIRNMIAGIGGIDAVLLVIAADDGWMPQTEEHLQIVNLLRIEHGIVAVTKIDLVSDHHWLDLVEEDIRERLKHSTLCEAPITKVSTKERTNIDELRRNIEDLSLKITTKKNLGKPYVPIDRAFNIRGSGTVVTGTLIDGTLSEGDNVTIFPVKINTRIRTLESYGKKVIKAEPGARVALNLVGVDKKVLTRGDIVFGGIDKICSSRFLDTHIELVTPLVSPLKNSIEVAICHGTCEVLGKIIFFGKKVLREGESDFAQIRLRNSLAARIGDRFVIRKLSPPVTLGGGVVLDPLASKHSIEEIDKIIHFLERRLNFEIEELILSELDKNRYVNRKDLLVASHYSSAEVTKSVKLLQEMDKLLVVGNWVIDLAHWHKQIRTTLDILGREHSLHPLRNGLPQAELKSRLDMPLELASFLIASLMDSREITREKDTLFLSSHKPQLSAEQEEVASKILKLFEEYRTNPPTTRELTFQVPGSEEIVRFMCRQHMLVELPEGVLFEHQHYNTVKNGIIDFLKQHESISIQQVRELFGFSRKHILPLLRILDEEGVTRRLGDERVLAKG